MAQQAATRYERAISMQNAAREMVELAEQGYETRRRKQTFDTAWQEMLNHATIKVSVLFLHWPPIPLCHPLYPSVSSLHPTLTL